MICALHLFHYSGNFLQLLFHARHYLTLWPNLSSVNTEILGH
ncbi:hypothetical protein LEMLEM_LOCUS23117 [Lemmus lemmus]